MLSMETLESMLQSIAHRGPDGQGTCSFVCAGTGHQVFLGHRRLAIIDPEGAHQPMCDADAGLALTFNGEIYGYRKLADELRGAGIPLRDRSDTEVLFQLIRRDGVRRAVECIDGMFTFAYRDGAAGWFSRRLRASSGLFSCRSSTTSPAVAGK